ncbi:hypothetical protein AEAC466_13360 [Asticcacaulis sp. AC466]|uniref:hypothetical protein n=1 Tax=Asticcacaulis sp. AC466 TaxID=1282362 RepID=UPI0003C3B509|nr:hypothetical protein [Asticcacaulis sp. AC466]ESQ83234.1 hypothetical protein AEAC466_13360 [Asticcacaulis sp. AC466]
MDWPSDADGDVMRRLQKGGFDFDREVEIDFNIDFDRWPPDASIMAVLANAFPSATVSVEEGYMRVQVRSLVTYAFDENAGRPHSDMCRIWRNMRELGDIMEAKLAVNSIGWCGSGPTALRRDLFAGAGAVTAALVSDRSFPWGHRAFAQPDVI